ncbi:daptide-type RiPP biosynthesis dehydogenase [Streptomyces sp. NPDC059819]|uniref:daptide-type RiPP biosynthesis dehydogenase n=1 Tax=Streptomyces sp. NPDC059819 TaxID=3346963 RepID=UPI0036577E57
MSTWPQGPTPVLLGLERIAELATGRRRTAVLIDSGVAGGELDARIGSVLTRAGAGCSRTVLTGAGDLGALDTLAGELAGADLVVGVGGGSLLDRAKLATLIRTGPDVRARLTVAQRGGLVLLPPARARTVPLVAVPTTLGTGSEVSGVVCLASPRGKRLVLGAGLRPQAAVLDPLATATLPLDLLAEGVLEALFRATGPYVGDLRDLPTEDALVEAAVVRLTRLGHEVARATRAGHRPDGRLRADIARLSGHTHAEWMHQGREPYAVKGWLLANELSSALGVRKMTAVAALLPPLWRAVADGDERLGSARRLLRVWRCLRAAGPAGLPADPARGIASLIDGWGIGRRLTGSARQLDDIARATVRAWGAGLPMLGSLERGDVRALLAEAAADAPAVPPPAAAIWRLPSRPTAAGDG